jgi:hypothetical protein
MKNKSSLGFVKNAKESLLGGGGSQKNKRGSSSASASEFADKVGGPLPPPEAAKIFKVDTADL